MATEVLMEISQDERERAILRSRRMYQTDQISNALTVARCSRKEIIELIEKGVPLDEIKRMFDL